MNKNDQHDKSEGQKNNEPGLQRESNPRPPEHRVEALSRLYPLRYECSKFTCGSSSKTQGFKGGGEREGKGETGRENACKLTTALNSQRFEITLLEDLSKIICNRKPYPILDKIVKIHTTLQI